MDTYLPAIIILAITATDIKVFCNIGKWLIKSECESLMTILSLNASKGSKAKIGIMAISSNNKIVKVFYSALCFIQLFSFKLCNTIAVEESANSKPIVNALCHSKAKK